MAGLVGMFDGVARQNIRAKAALLLGVAAVFLVSGCSAERVCPAVGYGSTLTVQLSGEIDQVAEVLVCGGADCSIEDKTESGSSFVEAVTVQNDQAIWSATLFYPEEPLTILVADENGAILNEVQMEPE